MWLLVFWLATTNLTDRSPHSTRSVWPACAFSLGAWFSCMVLASVWYAWCKTAKGVLSCGSVLLVGCLLTLVDLFLMRFLQALDSLIGRGRWLVAVAGVLTAVTAAGPCLLSALLVAKCCKGLPFAGCIAVGVLTLVLLRAVVPIEMGTSLPLNTQMALFNFACRLDTNPYACSVGSVTYILLQVVQVNFVLGVLPQMGVRIV